jgi:hypothetical protein
MCHTYASVGGLSLPWNWQRYRQFSLLFKAKPLRDFAFALPLIGGRFGHFQHSAQVPPERAGTDLVQKLKQFFCSIAINSVASNPWMVAGVVVRRRRSPLKFQGIWPTPPTMTCACFAIPVPASTGGGYWPLSTHPGSRCSLLNFGLVPFGLRYRQ